MWNTLVSIFPYAIAYTIPMLMTSLGGLYSERSGVTNLGLEGLMLVGYFASAITIKMSEATLGINALPIGLLVGVAAGAIFSLLHAFASINLKADQVISGTAINMLAAALTVYLARTISGSGNVRIMMGIVRKNIPFLSKIPIIGPLFFSQSYWTTWVCLAIWGLSWILLYKTSFGLRLRACGEHPSAVASAGISVHKMRYFGVAMSGALAGLGGAVILITYSGEFNGTVAGLGFLSIAALIFGQWKPLGILGATFFFGIATTIANVSQVIPSLQVIPPVFFKIFPYVATLLALVLFSKNSAAPKASGEPF
ncbi:ABC transporter permease [Sphaerochaeta halotolerans]|jgi:simple sugar transport system permease protein|uniref:ABC transporter permease n=1 Tax=Sphaerochaeta halotolerans TaxID=2293840 RepID=A0A372MLH0_9SPIR|nr:ABC transporter permease [Sphaerochaeta halotolerans]MBG0767547.1 ABC transporter permease [Spirochaetaceae bacterium]MDK2859124.1 ral nucleoside transport system permease protein [Sphaerochaeta sp.]MDN5333611.1 ral nucleoside transport system permease protein [Sphaerochaeta sp.]MXI87278.1 ABC transporter permease [Sphaerochaeta halotolerans]RFU96020.1 ABC transporter permease [Sphaerochaeta halotolerans]